MPAAEGLGVDLPIEPTLKGLATFIVHLVRNRTMLQDHDYHIKERPKLETIALGALTYRDVYVGDSLREPRLGQVDDFLQLRTYHIDYSKNILGNFQPMLTLMAQGCVCEDARYCDIEILKPYWLM